MLMTINIVLFLISIVSLVAFGFLLVSGFKRSVLWGLAILLIPFSTLVYAYKYWAEVKKPFLVYAGTSLLSFIVVGVLFMQMGGMQAVEMAEKINEGTLTEQDAARFMQSNMEGMKKLGVDTRQEALDQMRADPNVTDEHIKQAEAMFQQIEDVASGKQASFSDTTAEPAAAPSADALLAQLKKEAEQGVVNDPVPEKESTVDMYPKPTYVESPIKAPAPVAKALKGSGSQISVAEARNYLGKPMLVTTENGNERKVILVEVQGDTLVFQRRAFGGTLSFKMNKKDVKSLVLR